MIASRYIDKIVLAVTAIGLALVILAMCAVPALKNSGTGDAATLAYEEKLFDTSQIITLNIKMDKDDWKALLKNAIDEKYYRCDVVINGTTFQDVGIRAKGNTSLTSVYNDSTTQRYSLKLEFGHYIKKQTCWGLDKLVLNNNYADATNMKEAIVYDMFAYLGADASLYNYAKISVNGSYWGVYLALEAVEESFCLRNFGTESYELYKPETAGKNQNDDSGAVQTSGSGGKKGFPDKDGMPDFKNDGKDSDGKTGGDNLPARPDTDAKDTKTKDSASSSTDAAKDTKSKDSASSSGDTAKDNKTKDSASSSGDAAKDTKTKDSASSSTDAAKDTKTKDSASSSTDTTTKATAPQNDDSKRTPPAGNQRGGMGGMGMSGQGADLNYSDDDLDSYSTIWDGEVTKTHKADHRRVVTALKNISKGADLETYMNVDNVLRYMAVQTFVVNLDSLTGTMAHNYYLYESGGQLNILPWDYNLSFGGFQSGNASSTVNFPIDTPFTSSLSDRQFFASLLENKAYLAKYHSYLKKLSEQYVDGGAFAKTVSRIRGQIDTLVKTDPNAFYTEKEYKAAVSMLETVVKLRAKSVEGQLDGTIPATTDGQSKDSTALVDTSAVDLSVMGSMTGGKGGNGGFGNRKNQTAASKESGESQKQEQTASGSSGTAGASGGTPPSGGKNTGSSASSSKTGSGKKSA